MATQAFRVGCDCGGRPPEPGCRGSTCASDASAPGDDAGLVPDGGATDAGGDSGVAPDDAGTDSGTPTDGGGTDAGLLTVGPAYPANGTQWMDYVKNDGADAFSATDTPEGSRCRRASGA